MKFVEPGSGEVVAIRPDITPQIARLYAARPDALPSPARLCYDGPVLRAREARAGRPREVYQAGVELLGAGGAVGGRGGPRRARARARARRARAAVVEIGHARFAHAVIEAARLAPRARAAAWDALARKDEAALAALAGRRAATPACAQRSRSSRRLYGDGALARARALVRRVPGAAAALGEVEAALRLARRRGVSAVSVDLGETRGLGYYTGVTFAGYAPGAGSAVAAGGRYDELLARFGRPEPGDRVRGRPRVRDAGAGARRTGGQGAAPREKAASGRASGFPVRPGIVPHLPWRCDT